MTGRRRGQHHQAEGRDRRRQAPRARLSDARSRIVARSAITCRGRSRQQNPPGEAGAKPTRKGPGLRLHVIPPCSECPPDETFFPARGNPIIRLGTTKPNRFRLRPKVRYSMVGLVSVQNRTCRGAPLFGRACRDAQSHRQRELTLINVDSRHSKDPGTRAGTYFLLAKNCRLVR